MKKIYVGIVNDNIVSVHQDNIITYQNIDNKLDDEQLDDEEFFEFDEVELQVWGDDGKLWSKSHIHYKNELKRLLGIGKETN